MSIKKTIKSWAWRIKKAGLTSGDFARSIGISPSALSEYINWKKSPSIERFDFIEEELKKLGV